MNYRIIIVSYLFLSVFISCNEIQKLNKTHYKNVGDIAFDETIDDKDFNLCNESTIKQYYVRYSSDFGASYIGEKPAIIASFNRNYSHPKTEKEDGYIIIQFLVNCKGKSDRFRIQEMNLDYKPKRFENAIKDKLLTITKSLDGWIPVSDGIVDFDFYQYLSFQLKDGQIVKIMP